MRKRWLATFHAMAVRNPRLVFVGSDLSADPAFERLAADIGPRFFMEGVSEAYIVGMAAGLAMSGYVPYVNTIATFLTRRCYEQNAVDLGLSRANVRLIGGGGGLVYAPLGPTHLAIDDIALMRAIPNMAVVAVCDAQEMQAFMNVSLGWPHPIYIRLAKGGDPVVSRKENGFAIGKAIPMRRARARRPVVLMATGVMTTNSLAAAELLEREGIDAAVLHIHTV